MPSYRPSETMRQQMNALLALSSYKTEISVLERAVALLHWAETDERIRALMSDLDEADAFFVVKHAVFELYAREIADERDAFDLIAALEERLERLERRSLRDTGAITNGENNEST